MMFFVLSLFYVVGLSCGQILFKMTADNIKGMSDPYCIAREIALTWQFWGALVCYGITTIVWILLLSRSSLTTAYPITFLSVAVTYAAAYVFFNERLSISGYACLAVAMAFIYATITLGSNKA